MGETRNNYVILIENPEGKSPVDVDKRILLNCILKK
jgi:hypothetical protein